MDTNLQSQHHRQTTMRRNTTSLTLLIATLLFTASALASRPAMENSSQHVNHHAEEPRFNAPHQAVNSPAEMIMQQPEQSTRQQTGDVLQLPAKEMQVGETLNIKLLDSPRRGMSMDKVQSIFGQPIAMSASVGKPPITRWTYHDRIVFFEHATVIHAVAR